MPKALLDNLNAGVSKALVSPISKSVKRIEKVDSSLGHLFVQKPACLSAMHPQFGNSSRNRFAANPLKSQGHRRIAYWVIAPANHLFNSSGIGREVHFRTEHSAVTHVEMPKHETRFQKYLLHVRKF